VTAAALDVRELTVGYRRPDGRINVVVWEVSLALEAGRILGLAGESGCGKSTTALAAIGYRTSGAAILGGQALLGDVDLLALSTRPLRSIWGRRIVYLPQNAAASLNPALTIGRQLAEPLQVHLGLRNETLRERQLELLRQVALPDPEGKLSRYPHQLSGGQQQRVTIAIAISCRPDVVILDEPTTGLDVTTQARISALLRRLVTETGLAALYVSHDLALLANIADRLAVMYGGEIVEHGAVDVVCKSPGHPYTRALYGAVPSAHAPRSLQGIEGSPPASVATRSCAFAPRCRFAIEECRRGHVELRQLAPGYEVRCLRAHELPAVAADRERSGLEQALSSSEAGAPLLEVRNVSCAYGTGANAVLAVDDVSLELRSGETLGIVGESGSGKSTLLRAIIGLHRPSAGAVLLRGAVLTPRAVQRSRSVRREIQLVFQNPDLSLNPRHSVEAILRRPIRLLREDVPRSRERQVISELLDAVRLTSGVLGRYPFELSGGQRQRVAIARAFGARPSILLCDEATSSLDVSVQATILQLIADLSDEFETAVIFVSHDLAVIRTIAQRAIVMKDGVVRERGATRELFSTPRDEYTRSLIAAIPDLSPRGRTGTVAVGER
jgi:peptide/nickel transport system ATP-binding protein